MSVLADACVAIDDVCDTSAVTKLLTCYLENKAEAGASVRHEKEAPRFVDFARQRPSHTPAVIAAADSPPPLALPFLPPQTPT